MLSRRNIRIKVMQCIYATEKGAYVTPLQAENALKKSINNSYNLLLFNLFIIRQVALHARKEATLRANKKLKKAGDDNFDTRMADQNTIVAELENNAVFNELLKLYKVTALENEEQVKQMFRALIEHNEYKVYMLLAEPKWEDERDLLVHIYNKVVLANENFMQDLEELFPTWIDDQASVNFRINQLLTEKGALAAALSDKKKFGMDKEDQEFSLELLHKTSDNDKEFDIMIEPHLQNWDLERIAVLDMILMKMALCELLYFKNIPIKVSINEYIDISKIYSTPKSKDFINGVLDKLMNKLKEEGRIVKQGRGLLG